MNRFGSHRAPHVLASIASLALFLVGSNYCLLSALGGNTRMACMAVTADAAASPSCHHAAPSPESPTGTPASTPSCCPDPVVTPSGPSIDKGGDSLPPSAAAFLAAVDAPAPLLPSAWLGRPALPDGQPPTRLARAPLSARAPPPA